VDGLHNGAVLIDLILAGMVLEAVVLSVLHARSGLGIAPADLVPSLLAGACLLLALRASQLDAGWGWIALCLAAALAGHIGDLARRWRRAEKETLCPQGGKQN
jgi:hypothetical protein